MQRLRDVAVLGPFFAILMYALVLGSPGPSPGRRLACRRVLRLRGHGDTFDHLPDGGLLISDGDEEMRSTGEGEGVKSLDEVMLTRTEREQVKYWKKFEEAMVTELNEKNSTPFPVEKLFVSSNTTDTTWRAMELMKDCTTNAVQGNAEMSDGYLVFEHVFAVGEEIGLSFFHQFLRFVIALARDGKAETADGERVFDFITQQGIQPTEETYILMMNVICEGAKQKPQRGYLSEAYRWYEKSRKEGFESTQTIKEAYYEVYEAQSPNVYDIDLYRDNWCVLNSAEECLWQGFPEFGIEPHGSCTGLIPEEDLFNSTIQDMFKRDDNESSSDFNFTESETTSSSF